MMKSIWILAPVVLPAVAGIGLLVSSFMEHLKENGSKVSASSPERLKKRPSSAARSASPRSARLAASACFLQ